MVAGLCTVPQLILPESKVERASDLREGRLVRKELTHSTARCSFTEDRERDDRQNAGCLSAAAKV